jgi:SAM-dependent methyltransferase
MAGYGEDLAYTHDRGFGHVAEAAASYVLKLLPAAASVVELGCGSGITARRLTDAGHEVHGIDQSPALIALARERAPEARFTVGSFVTEPLPACDAVLAINEVLNYLCDEGNTCAALSGLFARIHAALRPRGLLLFDLAGPGVLHGDSRRHFSAGPDWAMLVEYRKQADVLTRHITSFVERGAGYRRSEEVHRQRLYRPDQILPLLRAARFSARSTRGYSPGLGRHVYLVRRPR